MKDKDNIYKIGSFSSDIQCASCESGRVVTRKEIKRFPYRTQKTKVELQACVTVYKCQDCEFEYTDREADELCHDAVCRYRNVMTPSEIRSIREKLNISANEISRRTGIGVASINRWENGALIQNTAMDGYLYLLGIPGNMEALIARRYSAMEKIPINKRFPTIKHEKLNVQVQSTFSLSMAA